MVNFLTRTTQRLIMLKGGTMRDLEVDRCAIQFIELRLVPSECLKVKIPCSEMAP